jgi:hypothetical protein
MILVFQAVVLALLLGLVAFVWTGVVKMWRGTF